METIDTLEKMNKLPADRRFFDINDLWYFPKRWAVQFFYPLPISANQITFLALIMGLISAGIYFWGGNTALIWGAIFLYLKSFLDNVDGNLARVREEESRLGRFLDSFSDFVVAVLVYAAVTWNLSLLSLQPGYYWALGGMALLSTLIQCSYWVYYYVNYTQWVGTYGLNRVDESVTAQDKEKLETGEISSITFFLQRFHQWVYGWQDRLIQQFDLICRRIAGYQEIEREREIWFADQKFLKLIGPLCVCTNSMGFVVFSLLGKIELFFLVVVVLGNIYMIGLSILKIRWFRRSKFKWKAKDPSF